MYTTISPRALFIPFFLKTFVSRVSDNAIFLGFSWISRALTEERYSRKKREEKGTRGGEKTEQWHVERRQQRNARFTMCPRGTHWFQMFLTDPPTPSPIVVMPRYRSRTPLAAKIAWLARVSARKPMLTRVGLPGIYEMPQAQSIGTIEKINSNEIDRGDIATEQMVRFVRIP